MGEPNLFLTNLSTSKSKRKSRVRSISVLLGVIGLAVLLSSIIILRPNQSASSSTLQPASNGASNGVSYAGPITFEFVGSNSTAATAAAGSTVQGAITVDILQAAPMRFLIDDRGYNTSVSTLPAGISISLNVYGNSYSPLLLSNAATQPVNTAPLVPTTLGETTVQYAISVANSVPNGAYDFGIVCLSFLNNGTLRGLAQTYEVTLSVQ